MRIGAVEVGARTDGSSRLEARDVLAVSSVLGGFPASGCVPAAAPRRERSGAAGIVTETTSNGEWLAVG
eukprot:8553574-Pyramimonas_sp.AAC.1